MLLDLTKTDTPLMMQWLHSAIAPRPIGLVSTIDKNGVPNLAPFSFFNLFSANPPIVIFSCLRRVRDNTEKHSLINADAVRNNSAVPEAVINIVTYDMVNRVNVASAEYPEGTNEFIKSGLTMEAASIVRPPMVKESKIKFECQVVEVKPLGYNAGAGNLVICNLLRMHIDDSIIDPKGQLDHLELDLVGRMGANWYCKTGPLSMFELPKPAGIPAGVDQLPPALKNSPAFTADQLAQLANIAAIPAGSINPDPYIQNQAAVLLNNGDVNKAWELLVCGKQLMPDSARQ